MKWFLCLVLAAGVVMVSCHPTIPQQQQQSPGDIYIEQPSHESVGLRLKRATCDLGSFQSKWVTPNHSLCAAHCLVKGYKGGNCKGTICHCRDKFF